MKLKGFLAERRAEKFLKKQGLKLIERNFRAKCGEIDLIMRDGSELIFVEVRSRSYDDFGSAQESVDYKKQSKIINTANIYLQKYKLMDSIDYRFDIVAINNGKLEWIKNAVET